MTSNPNHVARAGIDTSLSSFIAEVTSVRTNLSPFTKGYRGLASLMQFDPIYARRTPPVRGALITIHITISTVRQILSKLDFWDHVELGFHSKVGRAFIGTLAPLCEMSS